MPLLFNVTCLSSLIGDGICAIDTQHHEQWLDNHYPEWRICAQFPESPQPTPMQTPEQSGCNIEMQYDSSVNRDGLVGNFIADTGIRFAEFIIDYGNGWKDRHIDTDLFCYKSGDFAVCDNATNNDYMVFWFDEYGSQTFSIVANMDNFSAKLEKVGDDEYDNRVHGTIHINNKTVCKKIRDFAQVPTPEPTTAPDTCLVNISYNTIGNDAFYYNITDKSSYYQGNNIASINDYCSNDNSECEYMLYSTGSRYDFAIDLLHHPKHSAYYSGQGILIETPYLFWFIDTVWIYEGQTSVNYAIRIAGYGSKKKYAMLGCIPYDAKPYITKGDDNWYIMGEYNTGDYAYGDAVYFNLIGGCGATGTSSPDDDLFAVLLPEGNNTVSKYINYDKTYTNHTWPYYVSDERTPDSIARFDTEVEIKYTCHDSNWNTVSCDAENSISHSISGYYDSETGTTKNSSIIHKAVLTILGDQSCNQPQPTPTPANEPEENVCFNLTQLENDKNSGTYATFKSYMSSSAAMEIEISNTYKGKSYTIARGTWGEACDFMGSNCHGFFVNDTYIGDVWDFPSGSLAKCGKEFQFDITINLSLSVIKYRDLSDDTYTWYTILLSMNKVASDWYEPIDVHLCFTAAPEIYSAWGNADECTQWSGGTFTFKVSDLNLSETTAFNAASKKHDYAYSSDINVDIIDDTPYALVNHCNSDLGPYSNLVYLDCMMTSFEESTKWQFECTYNCTVNNCNPVKDTTCDSEMWERHEICKKDVCVPIHEISNTVARGTIDEGNPRNWKVNKTKFNMWSGKRRYDSQRYYEYSIYDSEGYEKTYYRDYM